MHPLTSLGIIPIQKYGETDPLPLALTTMCTVGSLQQLIHLCKMSLSLLLVVKIATFSDALSFNISLVLQSPW